MDAIQAIASRKSVRSYADRPLSGEELDAVVKAANSAPKAGAFHLSVVTCREALKTINDQALEAMRNSGNEFLMGRAAIPGYAPLYGAPALIVISAPDGPYSPVNCACAATAATIAATALGLGSCYVVTPTLALGADAELARKIGVPDGFKAMAGVLLGYAGGDKFAAPHPSAGDNVNYCR